MRIITAKSLRIRLIYIPSLVLLIASLAPASTPTKQFEAGKKAKVTIHTLSKIPASYGIAFFLSHRA